METIVRHRKGNVHQASSYIVRISIESTINNRHPNGESQSEDFDREFEHPKFSSEQHIKFRLKVNDEECDEHIACTGSYQDQRLQCLSTTITAVCLGICQSLLWIPNSLLIRPQFVGGSSVIPRSTRNSVRSRSLHKQLHRDIVEWGARCF